MERKKVSIITLGCKVNQYESGQIAKKLEENNIEVFHELKEADAYVINTCAVTNEAEKKSRGIVAKIRKVSKTAPLYIAGCSSQNDYTKFERFDNVKLIIGTSNKPSIADKIISDFNNQSELLINTEINTLYKEENFSQSDRTRAVIKIQEGCNNFCSYCLIPYLRGRERSRNLDSIINELNELNGKINEVIFTGINLSNWGIDFNNNFSLKNIAILMRNYPQIRFRFSSLEQNIISEDFLQVLKQTKNFAPHFHLSLQSGADKTLKFMNRKYTSSEFYKKVQLIRKYFDNPAITTDIIVGFPTETEEDFKECYNFAKKCKFAKIHIFPYSVRSGTVASKLKNVAINVKDRVQRLSNLDKEMFVSYINSCKNKNFTVIIERFNNGYYEGHTENYIKCYITPVNKLNQNQIVNVKIKSAYLDGAIAEII